MIQVERERRKPRTPGSKKTHTRKYWRTQVLFFSGGKGRKMTTHSLWRYILTYTSGRTNELAIIGLSICTLLASTVIQSVDVCCWGEHEMGVNLGSYFCVLFVVVYLVRLLGRPEPLCAADDGLNLFILIKCRAKDRVFRLSGRNEAKVNVPGSSIRKVQRQQGKISCVVVLHKNRIASERVDLRAHLFRNLPPMNTHSSESAFTSSLNRLLTRH